MSLQFSMNSSKYVHFWTLVLNTILILIKFIFQRYVSCRHLNFDPTYKIGRHGDFPSFWKLEILGLIDDFLVSTKIFWKSQGHIRTWNNNLSGLNNFYGTLFQGMDYLFLSTLSALKDFLNNYDSVMIIMRDFSATKELFKHHFTLISKD